MGLVESAVPQKYRARFTRAVAARRVVNAKGRAGATIAQHNADYKAMNSLPLWLQVLADKRAK